MYGSDIHNLIFDFGGVILNLHTENTHRAFALLANVPEMQIKDDVSRAAFFNDYEKGLLSDEEFREHVRKFLKIDASDEQIDKAWNAMLGIIPKERLLLLERLGKKHRVFLLSNTNNIHLQHFNGIVNAVSGKPALDSFFEHAYYSHVLKMRKPEVEIFEHVLNENKLDPAHTLFLDDNVDNLRGAESTGIKTAHVTHPDLIFSIFS